MRLLMIVCTSLLALTSCECVKPEKPSQTLRLNLADDPVSLDPRVVRSLKDLTVVKQLFDGLMRMDATGVPAPAIAESITVSDDLLTYTFHLREAYWTNGDPVTAHDFEYAWTTVLDPSFATDYSYMLYPIKNAKLAREGKCTPDAIGVAALDDRTLVVQLEAPTPYFLELTAFPTYFPVNHKIDAQLKLWAQPPCEQFVCNGPFKMQKWSPQAELQLVKNKSYWDQKSVPLQALQFSVIADNNTEHHLFEKDSLDWLGQPISHNIATELIGKVNGQDSFTVAGTFWLKFNTEQAPFNEPGVRRAFSYSINRGEIIQHILQGNQAVATGPLPPSMQVQDEIYFTDGDLDEARCCLEEVLEEKGWTRESFPKIVLNYPPSERNTKIVQLVQQQWKQALGIEVVLEAVENQLYRRNVREGLYQVGTADWIADFNDPLAFLELFKFRKQEGNGMNDTGWYNERFYTLLDASLTEKDAVKRKKMLNDAEKILVGAMPVAPIYHYAFDYIKKSYVKDVVLSPLGTADFKYATTE